MTDTWRSTALTPELADKADLILTATREHRSELCAARPGVAAKTFPLLQFAQWCAQLSPQDISPEKAGPRLLSRIQLERAYLTLSVRDVDLADPLGQPLRAFRQCDKIINRAVMALLSPL